MIDRYTYTRRLLHVMFALHQILFGLASVWMLFGLGIGEVTAGSASAVFLFWIGGTLAWGFACLMHG
jgi:hypothetical protein